MKIWILQVIGRDDQERTQLHGGSCMRDFERSILWWRYVLNGPEERMVLRTQTSINQRKKKEVLHAMLMAHSCLVEVASMCPREETDVGPFSWMDVTGPVSNTLR